VTGVVGFVLGGATSGVAGLVCAAVVAVFVALRRGLARRAALVGAIGATLLGTLGVVVLRSGDFGQFFSFLGVRHTSAAAAKNIETYPQHTVLAYIGLRIWLHHPIVGAGFEASKEFATYGRELPAAHKRFPKVSPLSFPASTRSYGIQDLYIQALADLGVIGFVLGGATSGVAGLVCAAVVAVLVAVRRGLARRAALVGAIGATLLGTLGVVALRSGDFGQFFSFLGVRHTSAAAAKNIETYPQHTVLAYIGLRIWLHHPIAGAGFEASKEFATYGRELPAAHKRFPKVSPLSFPSSTRSYGIQDLYVQALADLGVIGFALLVALFAAGIWLGLKAALRAPPATAFAALLGAFWLVMSLGFWGTQDFVAGIPIDAVTWLAFGAAVTRMGEIAA
jgi:O-antigen ligase